MGEREQVWAELIAQGEKVREEPVYSDAWTVAQETMRRVKANIETLYERLKTIGYAFQTRRAYRPPEPGIAARIEVFEREVGPLPFSLRAWLEIVGEVDFNGNYPGLCYDGSLRLPSVQITMPSGFYEGAEEQSTEKKEYFSHKTINLDIVSLMESDIFKGMRESFNRLPDSPGIIGALMKRLRDALIGEHSDTDLSTAIIEKMKKRRSHPRNQFNEDLIELYADPLSVGINPDELSVEYYHEWQEEMEAIDKSATSVPFALCIAPDACMKANKSGSIYEIRALSPGADTPVYGYGSEYIFGKDRKVMFIDYLRICFRWGGFPGLADEEGYRNEAVLKMLTEELLEI